MNNQQIEPYIKTRDKTALYRFHMDNKIDDEQLFIAIVKIDNSVKTKRINWLELIHNIFFPSAVKH